MLFTVVLQHTTDGQKIDLGWQPEDMKPLIDVLLM